MRELPIYTSRKIDGRRFQLAEKLDSYRVAVQARGEYAAEGLRCRVEPVPAEMCYYIWVGPKRLYKARTLPGEKIKRLIIKRRHLKLA